MSGLVQAYLEPCQNFMIENFYENGRDPSGSLF